MDIRSGFRALAVIRGDGASFPTTSGHEPEVGENSKS